MYNLKTTTGDFRANLSLYTPDQNEFIKEVMGDHLYFFGYTNHPTEKNFTDIFKFEEHSDYNLNRYYKFRQTNDEQLKESLANNISKAPVKSLEMNKEDHCISLFTDDMAGKTYEPARLTAKKELGIKDLSNDSPEKLSNLSFNTI